MPLATSITSLKSSSPLSLIAAPLAISPALKSIQLFFLLYSAYILGVGYFTFSQGYKVGKNVLDKITDPNILHKLTDCLGLVGMTIAGAMIITNVGIETSLVIKDVVIQDLLNEIAPNLLGAVATLTIFGFLRKGTSVWKIIIGLFVVGFACYFLGIL